MGNYLVTNNSSLRVENNASCPLRNHHIVVDESVTHEENLMNLD